MKVGITYACDLEDIPDTVSQLLGNLLENMIPLVGIDIQDASVYANDKNITEALASIDQARILLGKIDLRLMDFVTILSGYAKTNADLQMGIDPTMGDPSAVTGHTQEVIPQDILGIEEENVNTKKKEDD
tara:strand:- start:1115 stop:1504 length:390 start_codon:yes stop_codon:yes gene_type:complete